MKLLEVVDVRSNNITHMPDLSNLSLLTDLCCRDNSIQVHLSFYRTSHTCLQSIDFGLIGIRHIFGLDVSHNKVSAIPQNISRLVYLNEFDISGMQPGIRSNKY